MFVETLKTAENVYRQLADIKSELRDKVAITCCAIVSLVL